MATDTIVYTPTARLIRVRLAELGWSQARLSVEAGIAQSRIERIATIGKFMEPPEITAIAKALGITVEELVAGQPS